ncbi:proton-conducting transporter membrane subunit [Glaciecola petra]|uniref:Proton-conducting transporter membrane subunit n=1 Tax=Glaciecola petra TaxID=3075602 RepID=A0ABU2ZQ59_9ALTE|nr:proton-conducting transporter membrane subunit [Aestuariibacter sp. P117]MDT0594765.1 proton-conducting transporter membrane subunit [Aestuariibacter sp. P117]
MVELTYWLMASLLTPIVGALVISRLDKYENIREAITLITALSLFAINIYLYTQLDNAQQAGFVLAEPINGLSISFAVNDFGVMFALIASGLWIATSIYAIGYMRAHKEQHQTRFFTLFAVAIAGVMAVAFSENLFTLFIFYEFLTVSTYPLVTHSGTREAKRGGRKYILILMGSSILFFLPAMIWVYFIAGSLEFVEGGILSGSMDPAWVLPLLVLFILGIGKAGVMPMHKWLPSAMVAPTPVSALLHAVAVVKAGVFSVVKVVVFIFGTDFITESGANTILLWFPLVTIVLASFIALTKDNLKERLAYSTVSQLSYIVLGVMLATKNAVLGAGMHIAMHAFGKIALFFAAGAILVTMHKKAVSDLDGMGRAMPFTFLVFTIGTFSILGIPFFGGMWSKWYLLAGTLGFEGNEFMYWTVLSALAISTLLNTYYLLSIPMRAFFIQNPSYTDIQEAPKACLIGMAIPTIVTLYLFFDPSIFYQLSLSLTK